MGSIERFMSVLIEHTAGVFPVWMSPTQVSIVPVRENHNDGANKIKELLESKNIRVELEDSTDSLGKRINHAKAQKTPYVIVLGDKEVSSGNLTIEKRDLTAQAGWSKEEMKVEDFISKVEEEIKNKS
jgi:threonyl-tRNA synthetase